MKYKGGKKKGKSKLRQFNDWLHLWLGLISGIIVFIVSITGCIYVFQQDIKDALEPWRFVEAQDKSFVPPSYLVDTAQKYMPGIDPTGLTYSNAEGAAAVGFSYKENEKRAFNAVFMNPYTGEFIRNQKLMGDDSFDFFRFIIDGHRALWLPYEIGRPIVGVGTLIFVILLITGLVMWWPKKWNKSNRDKSFKIKWKASFKRVNYDLHNVLGFYSLIFALIIGLTGLVWSFKWFESSVYFLASGGETKEQHEHPHSDTTKMALADSTISPIDAAWYKTWEMDDDIQGMFMHPTVKDEEAVEMLVYHDHGSFYNQSEYFFDQYTHELIESEHFTEAGLADQLSMLNYDMHIGVVWGLPGKILAFLISLVCASLPITGFLVWYHRKFKKKKGKGKSVKKPKYPQTEIIPQV